MECKSYILTPLTCSQFEALFLDKYVPRTLRDGKKDKFMALDKSGMTLVAHEAKFMLCLEILLNC